MRRHWIDNLRWVTVLLVLLYHVIYFYNNKGVFGGVGGFGDGPQYQDVLLYVLYPWFMPLLFLLAGISARYALERQTAREWLKTRTRKLLVPSTIGLFFIHWITGYFNTHLTGQDVLAEAPAPIPGPVKYVIWSLNGVGPLWFIQVLWMLSLVLLLVHLLDRKDKCWTLCGKMSLLPIILLGVLFWVGEQTLIKQTDLNPAYGIYNLYRPLFYLIPFLLGWFVFSHDEVQERLKKAWLPLMVWAVVAGTALIVTTYGANYTEPRYQTSPLNCIYGWLMCLALMGLFFRHFNHSDNLFSRYMTRASFGIYVVHYLVVASIGHTLKYHTSLPPVAIYLTLTAAVFILSPLLYEALRRIPLLRWCIVGEKKERLK